MKNRQSWLTWGIIIALIIGSALLTVAWPAFSGMLGGGGSSEVRAPSENITIPLPVPVGGRNELSAPPWAWVAGLGFFIIGGIVTTAIVLALINYLVSRLVTKTVTDPGYQAEAAALQKKVDGKLKVQKAERPVHSIPDRTWQRFAAVTTTLSVLLFTMFGAYLVVRTFFPTGQMIQPDGLVNITSIVLWIVAALTVVGMILWLRGNRLARATRGDNAALPWDFVMVVLTGLLIVGLGIGFIALINN